MKLAGLFKPVANQPYTPVDYSGYIGENAFAVGCIESPLGPPALWGFRLSGARHFATPAA
jgi:hypothetical protein